MSFAASCSSLSSSCDILPITFLEAVVLSLKSVLDLPSSSFSLEISSTTNLDFVFQRTSICLVRNLECFSRPCIIRQLFEHHCVSSCIIISFFFLHNHRNFEDSNL